MTCVIPPLSTISLRRVLTNIKLRQLFTSWVRESRITLCILGWETKGKMLWRGRGEKGFWRITKEGARRALARLKSSTCGPHRSKTKPSISMPFNLLTWTSFPLFLFSSYAVLFVFRRFIPNWPFDPPNFSFILDLKLDYIFFNISFVILNIIMLD